MESNNYQWRKAAFISLQEPVKDIIACGNITIIWTKTSIMGYSLQENKIIWKIKLDDYSGCLFGKRLINFAGKAVFSLTYKPNSELVFAIEPETGTIIWSLSENFYKYYGLIASNPTNGIIPIYNKRKENFVESQYIVYVDIQTGKKVHETKIPFAYFKGVFAGNQLYIIDMSNNLMRADLNSPVRNFEKVCDGKVDFVTQMNGFVYYLVKDTAENYFIHQVNTQNNETKVYDWPEKKSLPYFNSNIIEDYMNAPDKLLISWGIKSDFNKKAGTYKFGLFDTTSNAFIWKDSFECNNHFIPTPNGFFTGVLFRKYNDGSIIEPGVKLDFMVPRSTHYANEGLFFYDWERLWIYKWTESSDNAIRANQDGTKILNFKDFVKV